MSFQAIGSLLDYSCRASRLSEALMQEVRPDMQQGASDKLEVMLFLKAGTD